MAITPLPPLDRTSATFRTDVDTFFGSQLPAFATEANALQTDVNAKQVTASAAAVTATTKAGEALTSAGNAATSETNADAAMDAAIVAQAAAEAALDSFDDRYLGAKAVAPTLDNDGNALLIGALYWDTVLPGMRAWTGAAWSTLPAATAAATANTPAGGITETDVQGALDGLDTRKANAGANSDITSLLPLAIVGKIQPITASVAANALTITLNPTILDFRSATLGSGTVNTRTVAAAISLVISSGSTLGTVSAQQSRIAVLAIDNAGTVELAAVNISGGNDLSETGVISTTAEGGAGASDSASTIYSTTARSNVPYRVVGYVESTQATAGTWAAAPSTIQGQGGQALAAMSSLGYGQTWQTVTGSRVAGTTYYNTTGRPIEVSVTLTSSTGPVAPQITVNGISWYGSGAPALGQQMNVVAVIPAGGSYSATVSSGTPSITSWNELR